MVKRVVCGVVLLGLLLAGCEQRKEKPVPGAWAGSERDAVPHPTMRKPLHLPKPVRLRRSRR